MKDLDFKQAALDFTREHGDKAAITMNCGIDVKRRWPWEMAMPVAEELVELLKPACERIAIAGSLRRLKRQVGDIEIVFVPRMIKRRDGLFDEKAVSMADELIEKKLSEGYFQKRPSKVGIFTWGEKNKLAIHNPTGIPVDLFAEYEPLDWWRSLAIRTGPKELNIELMATAPKVGVIAHAYGIGLTNTKGERIEVDSEEAFFLACGVKFRKPSER